MVVAILYLPLVFWGAFMVAILLGALYAQVYRYRHVSTPTGRQQTKWVTFGIPLWWLLTAVLSVPYGLVLSMPPGSPVPWWGLAGSGSWWLTLTILPLSLSIAVLRYCLYDIDVVINRALVYASLTATLGLLYFGSVASMQYAFRALAGHEVFPQLTIVVSTLVIAALFNPLRRRLQSLIDRRFYRSKYYARTTLEAFSAKLRDETDLNTLSDELVSVVRETVQPEHLSLWLRRGTVSGDRRQA
jgi:hypothetical protein